ncbi:cholecystokinin receptor-like [Amphiura filiformis]|uniref:cholecystokinin receptor-like n=1 Tax=Amphiura filiformis TaxID=82378 RepID=UPI003B21A0A8
MEPAYGYRETIETYAVNISANENFSTLYDFGSDICANGTDNLATSILVFASITYGLLFFFGVSGNALVAFVIWKNADMRSSTNYFLVNLCIADLMVLIFCIPSGLLETFKPMEWVLGPAMCYIVPFLENVTSQASILTLMAIAVERYYVIWRPLEVSYTCTPKRTLMVCLLVWLLASLCSIPPVIMVAYSSCEHWDGRIGHTCITYITSALGKSYVIGTTIVFFFLPCFFLTIVYALFANTLRKHDAYMNAIKDKETSTRLSDKNRIELSPVKSCNFKNNRYVKCATTPNDERKAEKDRLCGGEAYKRSPAVNHGDAFTASSRQTHRRVIYMLGSVVIVFFICWLPIRVMILWQIFASSEAFNRYMCIGVGLRLRFRARRSVNRRD